MFRISSKGTRIAKIAAHVGDTVRRPEGFRMEREVQMAEARHELDWDEQFRLALYGEHARKIHERDGETDTCSMCGDLCAVKMVNELFGTGKNGEAPGRGKTREEVIFLVWKIFHQFVFCLQLFRTVQTLQGVSPPPHDDSCFLVTPEQVIPTASQSAGAAREGQALSPPL